MCGVEGMKSHFTYTCPNHSGVGVIDYLILIMIHNSCMHFFVIPQSTIPIPLVSWYSTRRKSKRTEEQRRLGRVSKRLRDKLQKSSVTRIFSNEDDTRVYYDTQHEIVKVCTKSTVAECWEANLCSCWVWNSATGPSTLCFHTD